MILSDFAFGGNSQWKTFATVVAQPLEGWRFPGSSVLKRLLMAYKLLGMAASGDGVFISNYLTLEFFCLMNVMARKNVRVVAYECLWERPEGLFGHLFAGLKMGLLKSSCERFIVYSSKDAENFSREFHIDPEMFSVVRYGITLANPLNLAEKNYVFAGGDSHRDCHLLCQVARLVPHVPFLVACKNQNLVPKDRPDNVSVVTLSQSDYDRTMAESPVHFIPLDSRALRGAGHQTYLNAMSLGKAVVVVDATGSAHEYIRHGVDGFVFDKPYEIDRIAYMIEDLMSYPAFRENVFPKARARSQFFTGQSHVRCVMAVVQSAMQVAA